MRIIAGSRKGHKLFEFEGKDVRPTTDRVKESVFNLIQEFTRDAVVLDLFGGSGALSFEALSRGALSSTCIDVDSRSIELIKKNAGVLNFDNFEVINIDALKYIKSCKKQFSIIFLDPPYNKGFISPVIEEIIEHDLIEKDGIVVLESDFSDEHGDFDGLEIIKQKKYGRSYVTIYQKR